MSSDTEWIYFGAGDETNLPFAIQFITDYFPDSSLHIAINRSESITVNKNALVTSIGNILGVADFFIWDLKFKTVMEFSTIGVMRQGHI
jgi:hypothetical protein